ncbi:hypothetical protein BGW36DRAFT_430780 [Talaromyces proteolyticus]|uniref:Uncharacterized protein n=1 Tax=Talaromyces proteolyticus TaxID=1131652 RepID=A0AAD4KNA6_9EURO|nr:uncharacterized protein BGW36DRAFT_430780 [Talaromyces proteolyticus]KAH8693040.1 hypothetical protein BGW36DRAFT_430780 [Talaromyces proteolyticus]
MSAEAQPITPAVFAEAIKSLPLSSLYAKVSELRNSIAHLTRSNEELRLYVRDSEDGPDSPDNKELENYIVENERVMQSMAERIGLLKVEVEDRGQQWIEEALADGIDEADAESLVDGESPPAINGIQSHETSDHSEHVNGVRTPSNQPTNENGENSEDEGIHL